jgi:hypothetical protein
LEAFSDIDKHLGKVCILWLKSDHTLRFLV